ncbi:unnamed protein product [Chrysoparadoxa australica]
MNEERFIQLLTKLIGQVETLQNNPSQGLIPREDNASDLVMEVLAPFSVEQGGPLVVERVHFTEGRGNLIIKYPGTSDDTICFLGSHLDVVPANPETWEVDPFTLKRDGDVLYGRGTTDCLGHVALLTDLFCGLATVKPTLKRSVIAVFIANEENGEIEGVGVDGLHSSGKLDELNLKSGPVFWVDSADSQPCIGTAGNLQWTLKATGKLMHSGLPHNGINPLELVSEATAELQKRFYRDFPPHEMEKAYNYRIPSTMKPTQMECARGSINQIPPWASMSGDCRITPFYAISVVKDALLAHVADMNANLDALPTRGPCSKYELPAEGKKGLLEITWNTPGEDGVACTLDSPGNGALMRATAAVLGEAVPYAISGSLPLVRWMQDSGYDLQICGYGQSAKYHAQDESVSLSGMAKATRILAGVIAEMEAAD